MVLESLKMKACSRFTAIFVFYQWSRGFLAAQEAARCCCRAAAVLLRCCRGAALVLLWCCCGAAAVLLRYYSGAAAVLPRCCWHYQEKRRPLKILKLRAAAVLVWCCGVAAPLHLFKVCPHTLDRSRGRRIIILSLRSSVSSSSQNCGSL